MKSFLSRLSRSFWAGIWAAILSRFPGSVSRVPKTGQASTYNIPWIWISTILDTVIIITYSSGIQPGFECWCLASSRSRETHDTLVMMWCMIGNVVMLGLRLWMSSIFIFNVYVAHIGPPRSPITQPPILSKARGRGSGSFHINTFILHHDHRHLHLQTEAPGTHNKSDAENSCIWLIARDTLVHCNRTI
jgi:hypothetical protein